MRKTSAILLAAALPMAVQAANTEFTYGGFIKLDAMVSQYSDGKVGAASVGRDYYTPSATPVGGDKSTNFDMGAKSSRLNFKTVTTLDNGEKITGFAEMDFLSSAQGNEVASNSYSPRLRHFFFTYNNLTFGQTWTTFMNVGALPEVVDFFGVSDGTVFGRQSLIRYTMGDFQIALENSETNVNGLGAQDSSAVPDIIARYNINSGNLSLSVSAIARQIDIDTSVTTVDDNDTYIKTDDVSTTTKYDDSSIGFGVNIAGVLKMGSDDLKFSVSHGQLGRYVGLGTAVDAVLKGTDIEATDVTAAYIAYRHFWNPKLRSTIAYSMLEADYGVNNTGLTEKTNSARINLMYSPVKEVTYGVEYSHAQRDLDDTLVAGAVTAGDDGTMDRLQFTAKYSF